MKVQTERSNNRTNEMFYGNCCRRWRKTKISLLNHANCIEDLQVHTAGTELGEVCKSALELLEKNKDALFNVPGLPLKDSRAVPDTTNKLNKPLTRMEVDTISETPRKKKVRFEETVMIYPSVLLDAPPEAKEPTFGYHNPHTTRETSRLTQGDTFMRPYGARVSPTPGPWASPDGKAKVNTSKMRVSWEELEQDELDDDIEREFHASLDPAVVPPWLENEDLGLDSESDSDDDSDSDSSTSDTEVAHGDRVDDGSPSSSADPSGPNEQSPPRPSSVGTAERIPNPEDLFDPESWETINERITKGIDFLDAYGPWNDS